MIAQTSRDPWVRCTRCGSPVPEVLLGAAQPWSCGNCEAELQVEVFPALSREADPVQAGESLQTETEAGCFFHPDKKAVVSCASCGRFLCALCDIPLAGQRLCPTCVQLGRTQGRLTELVTRRTLYDQVALSLSIIPMLMVWLTIITAPMALYVACRYWKAPPSLLPRTRFRSVAAILIAGLQIMGWTTLLVYWVT
jgi:hypothetical protein